MIRQGEHGRWIAEIAGVDCVYQTQEEAINAEHEYIQYLIEEIKTGLEEALAVRRR